MMSMKKAAMPSMYSEKSRTARGAATGDDIRIAEPETMTEAAKITTSREPRAAGRKAETADSLLPRKNKGSTAPAR